jgi:hypothetical protein
MFLRKEYLDITQIIINRHKKNNHKYSLQISNIFNIK